MRASSGSQPRGCVIFSLQLVPFGFMWNPPPLYYLLIFLRSESCSTSTWEDCMWAANVKVKTIQARPWSGHGGDAVLDVFGGIYYSIGERSLRHLENQIGATNPNADTCHVGGCQNYGPFFGSLL